MNKLSCIICDKPAAHICSNGNTLCRSCLTSIRNSKISVSSVDSSSPDASAADADTAPGSMASAASIAVFTGDQS